MVNIDKQRGVYSMNTLYITGHVFACLIGMGGRLLDSGLVGEIARKVDIIQRRFEESFKVPLFLNFDLVSVFNLSTPVVDQDSLKGRLTDLVTQLIENINKKELDRLTNIDTKGSLLSLEMFLKRQFSEDTEQIEQQITTKLWAIYNIRTEYVHKKNRNFNKALEILSLDGKNLAPKNVWNSCIAATNEVLANLIELIFQVSSKQDNEFFIDIAIEKLKTEARIEVINLLSDYPSTEAYLHILINKNGILDTHLAELLSQDITIVRKNLYPILSQVILYSYKGNGTTYVRIIDDILPVVKGVLENNEDKKR